MATDITIQTERIERVLIKCPVKNKAKAEAYIIEHGYKPIHRWHAHKREGTFYFVKAERPVVPAVEDK